MSAQEHVGLSITCLTASTVRVVGSSRVVSWLAVDTSGRISVWECVRTRIKPNASNGAGATTEHQQQHKLVQILGLSSVVELPVRAFSHNVLSVDAERQLNSVCLCLQDHALPFAAYLPHAAQTSSEQLIVIGASGLNSLFLADVKTCLLYTSPSPRD